MFQQRCSWCQKTMNVLLRAVVRVHRATYEETNQIYFCNLLHGRLWKENIGRRFIRWERRPAI